MNLTNEQAEAITSLINDLDELDNKPRRLYYALEKFAFAFDVKEAIPSIREAQDFMYEHINEGEHYEELFRSLRHFKRDEWEWQLDKSTHDVERSIIAINGAKDFIKLHIKRLTERKFNI